MADKKHALYLADPDTGRVELVHADDVEDKQKAGWKQPEGQRPNGQDWNAEDDLAGQDVAADFAKQKAKADADKAAKEDAERQKAEAEKPEPQPTADLRVELVEPAGKSTASKSTTTSARSGTSAKK